MSSVTCAARAARTSISAELALSVEITPTAHAALATETGERASEPRRAAATHIPRRWATRESRRIPESSSRSTRALFALSAMILSIPAEMSGFTRRRPASSKTWSACRGSLVSFASLSTDFHSSCVIVHWEPQSSSARSPKSTRQSPSPAVAVNSSLSSATLRMSS